MHITSINIYTHQVVFPREIKIFRFMIFWGFWGRGGVQHFKECRQYIFQVVEVNIYNF